MAGIGLLLAIGVLVAIFVGFNIGGSSTGVAFGPAVGSGTISKLVAATLMTGFAFLGGWTVGRNVIDTMGGRIVPSSEFTILASVIVLFFIGLALLISNLFGVPASTSMTAVGAIAGLGVARGSLNYAVMGEIVSWWLVAPVMAFWVCAVIGRYLYPQLEAVLRLHRSGGALFALDRTGRVPTVELAEETTPREVVGAVLVVLIACYMAFSAGASNVANAVAPLVGSGEISPSLGVFIAAGAIGLGAFTIAKRTLDTVGNDLTDLPLTAALVVETVSATIITFLSAIGIPASLAVSAMMCIVGLGWGRATRSTTVADAASKAVRGEGRPSIEGVGSIAESAQERPPKLKDVPKIGEDEPAQLRASDLFDPAATGRVVFLWVLTPSISAVASFLVFSFLS